MSSAFRAFPTSASYDAFISYNWADKAAVRSYDKDLTGAGINVCIDYRHLRPGGRWLAELPAAIGGSGAVVVFYGPEGYGRTQSKEIELSIAADKKIIPVILPAVRENVDLPLDFVALHSGAATFQPAPTAPHAASHRRRAASSNGHGHSLTVVVL